MKKCIVVIAVMVSLISCHPDGRVYVEHKELSPDIEWLKADQREFKVPIEKLDQKYNLSLSFRYANGYQYEYAKVKVTEISPSGIEIVREHKLKVRQKNGEYIGERSRI